MPNLMKSSIIAHAAFKQAGWTWYDSKSPPSVSEIERFMGNLFTELEQEKDAGAIESGRIMINRDPDFPEEIAIYLDITVDDEKAES